MANCLIRTPQQLFSLHILSNILSNNRDRKKNFAFFLNYGPDETGFSRFSRIDSAKPFLEIRTHFFELTSIFVRNSRNRIHWILAAKTRKSVFPFEFRGTVWCNRFVGAWRIRFHWAIVKKIRKRFNDPLIKIYIINNQKDSNTQVSTAPIRIFLH